MILKPLVVFSVADEVALSVGVAVCGRLPFGVMAADETEGVDWLVLDEIPLDMAGTVGEGAMLFALLLAAYAAQASGVAKGGYM